ncbi:MAG: tetratricopeptide repeat protein [Okeania sp. SIO3I5]|uniref:tetratricopeptide repeat protein n=1 Tax=Okeania sp. SIO3I5 TaxID=2607805 RepID=UPI0013B7804A|nr:tetratricopeptide repeat protein [Okeania sp. SIO3I5]NEQ37510.1 tetratricopeptide repeat protein [Okeania sp. SIO3I5]
MSNNQSQSISLVEVANQLKIEGKLEEAIANFKAAVEVNPDCSLAWDGLVESYRKVIENSPQKLENYQVLGDILRKHGQHQVAIEYYHNALKNFPKNELIYGLIGDTYRKIKQFNEAIDYYRKGIELNPNSVLLYIRLGGIFRDQGNWEQAISYYRQAMELNQDNCLVYIGLGDVSRKQGNLEEAIAYYQDGLKKELRPDTVWLYLRLGGIFRDEGNWEQAISYYRQAMELNQDNCLVYIGLGDIYRKQGNLEEAIVYYQDGLKREFSPDTVWLYLRLGGIFKEQGNLEQAVSYYRQAMELNPDNSWIYIGLGDIYREQGNLEEAIVYYQDGLKRELSPKNVWLYIRLAGVFRDQGNLEQAISYYQQAMELKPDNSWVDIGLGDVCREQGNSEEAIVYYQDGLETLPQDYWLHIKLGEVFHQVNNFAAAITVYQKAIQLQPENLVGYKNLVAVHTNIGDIKAALETYEAAMIFNSNNPSIYVNLGNFYLNHLQNFEAALSNYEKALKLDSQNLSASLGKGKVLVKLGRFEAARNLFSEMAEQFPDETLGWENLAKVAQQQKKWQIALERWEITIDKFPENLSFYIAKGNVLIELGRFKEAEVVFNDVLEKSPYQSDGLCGLAWVLERQQKWELALTNWQEVIEKFPQNILAYMRCGEIFMKLERLAEAESIFQELSQYSNEGYLGLGHLYFRQSKYQAAIDNYQKASNSGKFLSAYPHLCRCFLTIGNLDKINEFVDDFMARKYMFNQHRLINEIIEACELAANGKLEQAWNIYQINLETCRDFYSKNLLEGLQYNHLVFILSVLSLVRSCLANNQPEFVDKIIDFVHQNQKIFIIQHITLSIIYLYLGLDSASAKKYNQAISHLQNSLLLNPDNQSCLPLIKTNLQQQYNHVTGQMPAVVNSSNSKIAIMIISCKKNLDKIKVLREKLYQKTNLPYCFVIGEPELSSDWQNEGDILYVKSPDNYESLPLKVFQAFQYFHCCFDFQGVLKLDDDTWIKDMPRFLELIDWLSTESTQDYMGNTIGYSIGRSWHFNKCESKSIDKTPYDLPFVARWCDGGSGYFLSRKSLEILFEYTMKYPGCFRGELYEDVLVSKILYLNGIKPYDFNLVQLGIISSDTQPNLQELDGEVFLKEGREAAKQRNFQVAIDKFQKAIEIQPDQPLKIYKSLSQFFVETNQTERAIAVLKATIDRFPEDASINLKLGNILADKGETESALKYYSQAIKIDPNQPPRIYRALKLQVFRVLKFEELGLAYLPIPKCASTTLKHTFYSLKFNQEYSGSIEQIHQFWYPYTDVLDNFKNLDNYFKFTVIRDPIKRLLSCYKNRVLYHKNLWLKSIRGKLENAGLKPEPDINYFVENLENYFQISDAMIHHALPQNKYIGKDLNIYDLICPIENLENLRQIISQKANIEIEFPRFQTEGPRITIQDLTEKSLRKLIEFYAEDYQLLQDFYSVDAIWQQYKNE